MRPLLPRLSLLLATTAALPGAAAPPDDTAVFQGRWTGVAVDHGATWRIPQLMDLEIVRDGDGLAVIDRDRVRGGKPAARLTISGRRVHVRYPGAWAASIDLTGTLAADGRRLMITMRGDGMAGEQTHVATLRHGDVAARAFLAPRIDRHGRRVATYRYRAPAARRDGLPVSTAAAEGLAPAAIEAMVRAILAETGDRTAPQTESVLVLRHGKLVLEEYFWGHHAADPHIISSATKSVTSMVAGIAWDAGRIALDTPVARYWLDRPDAGWVASAVPVTVRHALSMSSGARFDDPRGGGTSFQLLATHNMAGFAMAQMPVAAPGSVYHYDNSLPALMGATIAKATGEPFDAFAARHLFAALGIARYRWTTMPEGSPLAAGGLYLRPRDIAKIGQTMLDGGRWHGGRIVSAAWFRESTRQQTAPGAYPYGLYWHLNTAAQRHITGPDGFLALGQGGQVIAVLPALDMVVVTTAANWAGAENARGGPLDLISRYVVPAVR